MKSSCSSSSNNHKHSAVRKVNVPSLVMVNSPRVQQQGSSSHSDHLVVVSAHASSAHPATTSSTRNSSPRSSLNNSMTSSSSSNSPPQQLPRLPCKEFHSPQIKLHERDLLSSADNSSIMAFMPYLRIFAPGLHRVLSCQSFVKSLSVDEQVCMQSLVCYVYGHVVTFDRDLQSSLRYLLCLQEAHGDLVEIKQQALEHVKSSLRISNVLNALEMVDAYLVRIDQCFYGNNKILENDENGGLSRNVHVVNSVISQQTPPQRTEDGSTRMEDQKNSPWLQQLLHSYPSNSTSPLKIVRDYCLSFIKRNVYEQEFDLRFNPRIEKYIFQFYNRKPTDMEPWKERKYVVPSNALELLLEDPLSDHDFAICVNENEFIQVHKTILASNSLFFESLLQHQQHSNTSIFTDIRNQVFYPQPDTNVCPL
nr:unnamed protein product [Naegleria fowleri]